MKSQRLAELRAICEEIARRENELMPWLVGLARRDGASWEEIGEAVGLSARAARRRFAKEPA